MSKNIKLKSINTIVNNDYISKINDIVDNVKNITLEVKIKKYKKLEFENNIMVILHIEDNTGKISALLGVNRNDEKLLKIINKINIGSNYRVMGNISFINEDNFEELNNINIKDDLIEDKILFIKGIQNIDNIYSGEIH